MAAGIGQLIEASDYSSIKAKADLIFGVSSGQSGYGQPITSPAIASGTVATAAQWLALRTDMVKARQHQTGVSVGVSNATDGNNLLVPVSSELITNELRNQYNLFADTITNDKFLVAPSQLTTEVVAVGTRTTAWNGVLTHSVVLTGDSSGAGSINNLRFFFNAGGKVRISASRAGGASTPKNSSWTTLLSEMGTITMDYTSTTYSGINGIVSSSIGWADLTTTNQLLFQKNAGAGYYSSNRYFVYARINSTGSQLILTMQFADYDTGVTGHVPGHAYLTDENIDGVLTSQVVQLRPTGSNVSVLTPSAAQSGL